MSPLTEWANFYVIIGSSAGALTGLTFIAVTFIGDEQRRGAGLAIPAFTTPTVVQLGLTLLLSAALSAPWSTLTQVATLLVIAAIGMLIYGAIVVRRLRRVESYKLVLEDWVWYGICPLIANLGLGVAALLLADHPTPALFGVAAVLLFLIFIALHNAWDIVTWMVIQRVDQHPSDGASHDSGGDGASQD